ncbi:MAG: FtsX-like permease family protein [Candidatus Bathyarchaeia archaeon]
MPKKVFVCFSIFFLAFAWMGAFAPTSGQVGVSEVGPFVDRINMTRVQEHIRVLSSLPLGKPPSRFTGSEGFWQAAAYINDTLRSYGYSSVFEEFTMTVPVDDGATLTVTVGAETRRIVAYPLLPNTVNPSVTPRGGLEGRLIYAGTSQLYEFNNETVTDSIVLVEYNSRWYWKNAAMLGAKAVVFIEPEDTTQVESRAKTLQIPVNFPRVYISREDGLYLLDLLKSGLSPTVKLESRMHWENVKVPNIIARVAGREGRDSIVVTAWYDSYSVVPSVAPGATEAINVAALLELARVYSDLGFAPRRSVILAFMAGHGQVSWGAREFVDRHFMEIGTVMKMMVGLDLSCDSQDLGLYAKGSLYQYKTRIESLRFPWVNDRIVRYYVPAVAAHTGRNYRVFSAMFPVEPVSDPNPLIFDTDAFTVAGGAGMTFHTTNSLRQRAGTPLDRAELIDYRYIAPQLEVVFASVYAFSQEAQLSVPGSPTRIESDGGFATIEGTVGLYNLTMAWYDPFEHPYTVVHVSWPLAIPETGAQFTPIVKETPNLDLFIRAERQVTSEGVARDGVFIVKGIKPYTVVRVEAYAFDPETGELTHATDFGIYGLGKGFPTPPATATSPGGANVWIYQALTPLWLPVFEASSIILYNVVDPTTATVAPLGILNYNFLSHDWNLQHAEDIFGSDAMVFVPSGIPVELIVQVGSPPAPYPMVVFGNMTEDRPEGNGYTLRPRESMVIYNTPYVAAYQVWLLMESRIEITRQRSTYSAQAEDYRRMAYERLQLAKSAYEEKEWDVMIASALSAWGFARSAYLASMSLVIDVIKTVVFFFILMIPLSVVLQRLLIPRWRGLRAVIGFIAIFLGAIGFLWVFHPGFHIAFNVYMILIAATVTVFAGLVVLQVGSEGFKATGALQERVLGIHSMVTSRIGTTLLALSAGVENMKKHRFRTALTLVSLILVTVVLIALTSASFVILMVASEKRGVTPYNGLLVRDADYAPLSEQMARAIEATYKENATVSERTWTVQALGWQVEGAVVEGVLGLTPQEQYFTDVAKTLVDGRWFTPEDEQVAIISGSMAKEMKKARGDTIEWMGLRLYIIGVFNHSLWTSSALDLDQVYISPIIWEGQAPRPLTPDRIIIVPYSLLVRQFNFYPFTVAVRFENATDVLPAAYNSALQMLRLTVFAGKEGLITIYNPWTFYTVTGGESLPVPMAIVSFLVLNVMLAAVYERAREIQVFSVVGVNPRSISTMFLAESVMLAVISAGVGYLVGMGTIFMIDRLHLTPTGFYLNYASTFVVVGIAVVMAMTTLSALFPAWRAARLVTPSLRRRWELATRPRGDNWTVPLPFTLEENEAKAALMYLKEFAEASTATYGIFKVMAETIKYQEEEKSNVLSFNAMLAPYDLGIQQVVKVVANPAEKGETYTFSVELLRLTGHRDPWMLANYRFIDRLRKQLLLWRALSPEDKKVYFDEVEKVRNK